MMAATINGAGAISIFTLKAFFIIIKGALIFALTTAIIILTRIICAINWIFARLFAFAIINIILYYGMKLYFSGSLF